MCQVLEIIGEKLYIIMETSKKYGGKQLLEALHTFP